METSFTLCSSDGCWCRQQAYMTTQVTLPADLVERFANAAVSIHDFWAVVAACKHVSVSPHPRQVNPNDIPTTVVGVV